MSFVKGSYRPIRDLQAGVTFFCGGALVPYVVHEIQENNDSYVIYYHCANIHDNELDPTSTEEQVYTDIFKGDWTVEIMRDFLKA